MNKSTNPGPLYIPALKCKMGDWSYYACYLTLAEAARRIQRSNQIHRSKSLDDFTQRVLMQSHADNIADYLIREKSRFFSSIVVGLYGGSPRWLDLELADTGVLPEDLIPEDARADIDGALGVLILRGDEQLFAIDGQHRVQGIRQAVERSPSLGDDVVSVLFIADNPAYEHRQRTRWLFSTLNKHAKPVSMGDKVALDEDDAFAITTRRLLNEHPLLCEDRAYAYRGPSIPKTDQKSFTNMLTVYQVAVILGQDRPLDGRKATWSRKDLTLTRPPEETIEALYTLCATYWTDLADTFPEIGALRKDSPAAVVARNRNEEGGHLLFRPVGQMSFARCVRRAVDSAVSQRRALRDLGGLDYRLSSPPWSGLFWNPLTRKMAGQGVEVQQLGGDLMLFYASILTPFGETKQEALMLELQQRYRQVTNNPDASLPISLTR